MEWQEDEITGLIEAYKNCSTLWDPADSNYYRKEVKNEGWQTVAAQVNRPEEECRRKMLSLLSSYRRERNREKRLSTQGMGKFSSRWFAYEPMKFLESRGTRGPEVDYQKRDSGTDEASELDEDNGADDDVPFELYPIQNIDDASTEVEEEKYAQAFKRPHDEHDNSALKKSRRESTKDHRQQPDSCQSMLSSAADILKTALTSLNKSKDNCEVKTFCDYLQAKMLTYSMKTKRSVQHAIFDIIMQADQGTLDKDK